jgi:hypothetical protein
MCLFEILSIFLKTQIKLGQVSGSYLNPPLLGMTLNKNVLKNIGGEITDGILLNGDAQKIKVITGGEITCPLSRNRFEKIRSYLHINDNDKMKNREDSDYD